MLSLPPCQEVFVWQSAEKGRREKGVLRGAGSWQYISAGGVKQTFLGAWEWHVLKPLPIPSGSGTPTLLQTKQAWLWPGGR